VPRVSQRSQSTIEGDVTPFDTKRLPAERDAVAPDGSDVRVLLELNGGSMAHFELPAGQTSKAAGLIGAPANARGAPSCQRSAQASRCCGQS